MRVITGTARGHPLKVPKSAATRPTPARAKEAIFSSLAARVENARVLELFAGSGALGIEALSRGAASALFVESNRDAARTLRENLRTTRLEANAEIFESRVEDELGRLARQGRSFDLIFADPPYAGEAPGKMGWMPYLLGSDALHSILVETGRLLVEHSKKEKASESRLFEPQKEFRFGDTAITVFLRRSALPPAAS
ncbi:MAG: 16S rRNA (guanine(966)-N(2))-methyltransferase RsmD [Verrucomicrobiae bacterium]|nr:16S rRNA (guanine(966)-N(2))-methyltransferase RsmD [Verrucomicrobiae bacterium]